MKKRIDQAKAGYKKATKSRITNNQIREQLFPKMNQQTFNMTFCRIKKGTRNLEYNEMLKLAEILHCTPQFLNGSEKYSFIH